MTKLIFISHPGVAIDPNIPIPHWHLNNEGIALMRHFANSTTVQNVSSVWSSSETKAIEAAGILAAAKGLSVIVEKGLEEIDRSATGYLPRDEFEATTDLFFDQPSASACGWETAQAAQIRIIQSLSGLLRKLVGIQGDIAIVGHGGTGTLLYCQLARLPITRIYDQPHPGHYWTYQLDTQQMLHGWRALD